MWCFWSAKGGVGCTVVATAVAVELARLGPTLMVDLGGDVAPLVGRPPGNAGLAQWLDAAAPPPDALSRLEVELAPNLVALSWDPVLDGAAMELERDLETDAERAAVLARLVDFEDRSIVVDLGVRPGGLDRRSGFGERLLSMAARSTLVTRACHLAVRAAQALPPPDDVVLVARRGRSLRAADVEAAVGAPVRAEIRWDPAVARAVDAGRFASRSHRSLRALRLLSSPRSPRRSP